MKILIATHNQSKLERYRKILKAIPNLETVALSNLGITEKAEETYETSEENALHKARFYGELSGLITIAIDEAVMTNFLPDNEQPGVYARRFTKDKKELTDEKLIEVWKEIFKRYPQENKQFIWDFAVAFFNPKNKMEGVEHIEMISFVAKKFSSLKTNGYPMSALLSSSINGKPYIEMSQEEREEKDIKNFSSFIEIFDNWNKLQNNKII